MTVEHFFQGKYEFSWRFYSPDEFHPDVLVGRTLDMKFARQLLVTGLIIQPIITTLFEGNQYLMDGANRVLHAKWIVSQEKEDLGVMIDYDHKEVFGSISAKMFYNINPDDQAVWSIILNEERSSNPVQSWLQIYELQKQGKWDEYVEQYRLNKQTMNSMAKLGDLIEPEYWIGLHSAGRISTDNLFSVAKLPGLYQEAAKELAVSLPEKKSFTGGHLKRVKTVRTARALSTQPGIPELSVLPLYVILQGDTLIDGPFRGKRDPGGNKLYQLVPVS